MRTIAEMLALSPTEFEHAIATLYQDIGYTDVQVVRGAGDYAADVMATSPAGLKTIVQCKRYGRDNTVGSQVVQGFLGMATIHHKADRAILVTTSGFTANARTIEKQSNGILQLIDGARLAQMIRATPSSAAHHDHAASS